MIFLRGLAGVLLGFGVFAGLIRLLPGFTEPLASAPASTYLFVNIVWTVVAAIIGGYLAALLAGSHEFPFAAAVGMLIIGVGLMSMRQEGATRPGWYHITLAGCGPISAMIGAALRVLTKRRQPANSNTSAEAIRR